MHLTAWEGAGNASWAASDGGHHGPVISLSPVTLARGAVRLEPLAPEHLDGIAAASADGELWKTWFTKVPHPDAVPE